MPTTEERIHALEAAVSRWRRNVVILGVMMVAGVVVVAIRAWSPPEESTPEKRIADVIRARRVVVFNAEDTPVVDLNSTKDGGGAAAIKQKHGIPQVVLAALPEDRGGGLLLYDGWAQRRVVVAGGGRSSGMQVLSESGEPVTTVGVTRSGTGVVTVDTRTEEAISLGSGFITVGREGPNLGFGLNEGEPTMLLRGQNATVALYSNGDEPAVSLHATESGGEVTVFGEGGKQAQLVVEK